MLATALHKDTPPPKEAYPQAFFAQVPDTDGHLLVIPFITSTPLNTEITPSTITPEQKQTLIFATYNLRLPPLVATHLVCNQGLNIGQIQSQYGKPLSDNTPILLTVYGPSCAGKSTFLAVLEKVFPNSPLQIANLDGFSSQNLDYARQVFEGIDTPPFSPHQLEGLNNTIDTLVNALKTDLKQQTSWPPPSQYTAKEALDKLCQFYQHGQRPPILLADMPGRRLDHQTGQPTDPENVFDWLAQFSAPEIALSRLIPNSLGSLTTATFQDLDPNVIYDYIIAFLVELQNQNILGFLAHDQFLADFSRLIS